MTPTHRLPALLAALLAFTALAGCTGDGAASTRLVIDFPEPRADVDAQIPLADVAGQAGTASARGQLLAWGAASGTDVRIAQFTFGHCLDAIDGLPTKPGCSPGSEAYWALAVNGQAAASGMDEILLADGDVVTWTYTPIEAGSSSSAAGPVLTVDTPAPTQEDMVMLTGTLDRAARVSVTGAAPVDAEAGPWMVHVPLEYGHSNLTVIADDGEATSTQQVVAIRLAQATMEVVYTAAVPPHAATTHTVWYDPGAFASAALYEEAGAEHPPIANVHDVMVTWTQQTGIAVEYGGPGSFGFGVDKIDGVGQPLTASAPPYWGYEVNGETAPLGITSMEVHPGDVIRWEYLA